MNNRKEYARSLFLKGFTCSQAIFCSFADVMNIDTDTALKISAGLGGGVGRMRQVCGAVTSASMVLGWFYGATRGEDSDSKAKTYLKTRQFAELFREREGSIICRDLLGIGDKEESHVPGERTAEYYASRPCLKITGDAVEILEKILSEDGKI